MKSRSKMGSELICFSQYADGAVAQLLPDTRTSFLFVLHGTLICTFTNSRQRVVREHQMVVIEKSQLKELCCVGSTVLLECVGSGKISLLMKSTLRAFGVSSSEVIPLNVEIMNWCNRIFTYLNQGLTCDNNYYYFRCKELAALLLAYPQSTLGTLYIPLYACARQCESCSKQFLTASYLNSTEETQSL